MNDQCSELAPQSTDLGGTEMLLFITPLWERSGDCLKSPRRTAGWLGTGSLGPRLQQDEAVSS